MPEQHVHGLREERRPDILYRSLTDYIRHAYAPGHPEAERFYAEMDTHFTRIKNVNLRW